MTLAPTPYDILRAIQDQQRATDRLVQMLAGMLDKSGPEPLLTGGPGLAAKTPAEAAIWHPRAKAQSNRPTRKIIVAGTPVIVSEMRAKMVEALRERPRTTEEIVALKLSTSADAVRKAFVALNFDFSKLGIPLRIKPVERLSRVGPKGGSILPRYALVDAESKIAPPGTLPAAQSEAAAGERPEQEASASAVGDGDGTLPAHDAPFVTPDGGEVATIATESPSPVDDPVSRTGERGDAAIKPRSCPELSSAKASLDSDAGPAPAGNAKRPAQPFIAGDERKPVLGIVDGPDRALDLWSTTDMLRGEIARQIGVSRTTVNNYLTEARAALDPRVIAGDSRRAPIPMPAPPPARTSATPIEPGDLLAVDVKQMRVQTNAGAYEVGGVNLARALDFMKTGHLFGLDVIAKRAGWPTADVAKTALGFEKNRLAQHGIDLFLDKFHARLREAS